MDLFPVHYTIPISKIHLKRLQKAQQSTQGVQRVEMEKQTFVWWSRVMDGSIQHLLALLSVMV